MANENPISSSETKFDNKHKRQSKDLDDEILKRKFTQSKSTEARDSNSEVLQQQKKFIGLSLNWIVSSLAILISFIALLVTGYVYKHSSDINTKVISNQSNIDLFKQQLANINKTHQDLSSIQSLIKNRQEQLASQLQQYSILLNQISDKLQAIIIKQQEYQGEEFDINNVKNTFLEQILQITIVQAKQALVGQQDIEQGVLLLKQAATIIKRLPPEYVDVYGQAIEKDLIQLSLINAVPVKQLLDELFTLEKNVVNLTFASQSQPSIKESHNKNSLAINREVTDESNIRASLDKSFSNFLQKFVQIRRNDRIIVDTYQDQNLIKSQLLFKLELLESTVLSKDIELFHQIKKSIIDLSANYLAANNEYNQKFLLDISKLELVKYDFSNLQILNIAIKN